MFESLSKVKNPVLRSTVAASTALAIVTMISAVAIGAANPKNKSAYKSGVYVSLIATVLGGVLGLVVVDKSKQKTSVADTKTDNDIWKDWRNFVVDRKVKESKEITSFYLKPQDREHIPDFKPGQFLTIKLDIPEQPRPVIRTYSLSDSPNSGEYYRLSIKREGSPKGLDVPPGVASNFMHDRIKEGSIIPAKPPNGKFFLDLNKSLPAVLISNGVGITPMISMAKAASRLNKERHIWFLHGARNGEFHAFRDAVNAIAQENPNLHVHYSYSRPRSEDKDFYHSQGYVDKELLEQSVIPEIERIYGTTDAEYFLCGSPAFMDSIRTGLDELGVPKNRVFFESFSKGSKATAETKSDSNLDSAEIVFTESGKTLTWQKGDGTILEFAETNGINPPYSCRQGICLTCMCQINEGEVEYTEPPTGTPDDGSVLICISQPKTDKVVLEL
ncbi:MAG: 2Fe-2S iron-sulfur cluster-binding protein [Xenococcaceae cyanobacterium MO_188.B32]|nr:2Fe-2S iron-sulfur cluster-binding protein [Xenococcaceae cyanobacterium MO_188.B32]